jgi:uncharacterized spore protein YtfJ
MSHRELIGAVCEAMSARRVFGEPVERDGVTVIPAATVIGGGGTGVGEGASEGPESEPRRQGGFGAGFGGVMWPAGAFEIRDGRVTWRPAIDLTRVLITALTLAIAVARARSRR